MNKLIIVEKVIDKIMHDNDFLPIDSGAINKVYTHKYNLIGSLQGLRRAEIKIMPIHKMQGAMDYPNIIHVSKNTVFARQP